ncbi:DUF5126 domain-containing protein [Pedobacter sp. BS3]|uniref:DUF5000 domain-containing lipoprotein n=1 Tax=Pedobacter sp. BS3 TaxID=2567937 RepID=UPI0011ED7A15|nr:DUF5000 domain-containing lipoprotein [Pedobacter sp. BS3]TZF82821.1 DUF5126 domain-containing protein [Pedobacter sp. BS3]
MKKYLILIVLIVIAYGCTKEGRLDDVVDDNAPAPALISNVKVEAKPGGAILTYKVPDDPNFYYAKAVYEIRPGVYREAKATLYNDTLALVGYGDTLTHEVKLYSIGKNRKQSEPLTVSVKPLKPPVYSAFETVGMAATFGGVQVSFENAARADLAIEVLTDSTGLNTWSNLYTFYTAAPQGQFSVRGLPSVEKKFGVVVRDRWSNKSDTLQMTLTPLFEELIPKNTWKAVHLPNDTWQGASSGLVFEHVFDGSLEVYAGTFGSPNNSVLPQWFTIDLGKKVIISRIREHQAYGSHMYNGSAVKKFELWGSNNPDADGGWNNWERLGTFDSFKPSGLPLGQTNDEDKNYAWFLGEEFAFTELKPAYRYIRWKSLQTYASAGQIVITELDIYGQIQP